MSEDLWGLDTPTAVVSAHQEVGRITGSGRQLDPKSICIIFEPRNEWENEKKMIVPVSMIETEDKRRSKMEKEEAKRILLMEVLRRP